MTCMHLRREYEPTGDRILVSCASCAAAGSAPRCPVLLKSGARCKQMAGDGEICDTHARAQAREAGRDVGATCRPRALYRLSAGELLAAVDDNRAVHDPERGWLIVIDGEIRHIGTALAGLERDGLVTLSVGGATLTAAGVEVLDITRAAW